MEGENRVFLMGKPEDGGVFQYIDIPFCSLVPTEYVITMPSMYARGILFGKMVLELGDSCTVRNERTGMHCDVDFKTKVGSHASACILWHGEFSLTGVAGLLHRHIQQRDRAHKEV